MIHLKKWKFFLLGCLFFVACKSTDCGCPMAENEPVEETKQKETLKAQKQWRGISR